MKSSDLDRSTVETAYARWAPVYDAVCGPVMVKGGCSGGACGRRQDSRGRCRHRPVIRRLRLQHRNHRDRSFRADAGEGAREKMASGRYPFVKDVRLMDAHRMAFADATFDCVVAQFVITLVANPEQVLSECRRVVKPGGRIILVNHLYSEKGVAAAVERWAAQRTRALGLRPRISVRATAGVGPGQQRRHSRRAAQGRAVRDLYPGLFRTGGSSGGVNRHRAVTGLC
jgi:phosphatidylethanolamine/phosphatidyl-N-methylethanolamine N-methyltransferase